MGLHKGFSDVSALLCLYENMLPSHSQWQKLEGLFKYSQAGVLLHTWFFLMGEFSPSIVRKQVVYKNSTFIVVFFLCILEIYWSGFLFWPTESMMLCTCNSLLAGVTKGLYSGLNCFKPSWLSHLPINVVLSDEASAFLVYSFKISFNLLLTLRKSKTLTARLSNSMGLCKQSIYLGNALGPCSEEYGCTAAGLLEDAIRMERGGCRELLFLRMKSAPPVCAVTSRVSGFGDRCWWEEGCELVSEGLNANTLSNKGFEHHRISHSPSFLWLGSLMIKAPPISA